MKRLLIIICFMILSVMVSCKHANNEDDANVLLESTIEQNGNEEIPLDTTETPEEISLTNQAEIEKENPSTTEDETIITVHNATEIIDNLASNTHFMLMEGDYDFSGFYDFKGYDGITFEGASDQQIDFFATNYSSSVLYLKDCTNCTFINLNMGHAPNIEKKPCQGEVVWLSECSGISFENCTMFGCGTVGIYAVDVNGLNCKDCVIKDCRFNIVAFYEVNHVVFDNCIFKNDDLQSLSFRNSHIIELTDCELIGGKMCEYPQVLYDEVNIVEEPNDGITHVIENLQYKDVTIKNLSTIGMTLSRDIEEIHEGLHVSMEHGDYGERGYEWGPYISCVLKYQDPLDENEYISQIESAKKLIDDNLQEEMVIHLQADWPGMDNAISIGHSGEIILSDFEFNMNEVMNTPAKYLTIDEAKGLLQNQFKAFLGRGNPLEYIGTVIENDVAYYTFCIPTGDHFNNHFNIQAIDGTISTILNYDIRYSILGQVSKEQIDAVIKYSEELGLPIENVEDKLIYILEEKYIFIYSDSTFVGSYEITEENGQYKADWYDSYYAD